MVSWRRLNGRPLTEFDGDSINASPGRSLDSAFQPNEFRPTFVIYSIEMNAGNGEDGKVELKSDSSSSPSTVIVSQRIDNDAGGESTYTGHLTHIVPAGHYVELVTTSTTGTVNFSISNQTEITL